MREREREREREKFSPKSGMQQTEVDRHLQHFYTACNTLLHFIQLLMHFI